MGKSALTKRMKRRSALASDWLEKNQSELAESSLNSIERVPNVHVEDYGNDSTLNDVKNGIDKGSEPEKLTKFNVEKLSNKSIEVKDHVIECHEELTVNETSEKSFPQGIKTTDDVPGRKANEKNGYDSSNISDKNPEFLSMNQNNIDSSRINSSSKIPVSCDNNAKMLPTKNAESQNVESNSTTKRKRTTVVEKSAISEDMELPFEDEVKLKPTKKRKTVDDVDAEASVEQADNDKTKESVEMESESDDEQSQSCSSQKNNIKKR